MSETVQVYMKAADTLFASMARCYIVIGDKRYNFMNMINMEVTFKKNKVAVAILGRTGKGHKSAGWEATGKGKMYYNSTVMRKMAENYKNTGEDVYFDIQIVNEDKGTSVGKQEILLKDCNLDSLILAKFDADGELLDEDIEFTVDDFEIKEGFKELAGMLGE
ncbi:MAG: phage tail tube protein [Lachnospiraceae bacterium]|nr:phage tail tube protein [Lachnospiraceae bacterium]